MNEFLDKLLDSLRSPWAVVGFAGQAMFFSRFLVQWIQSERAGRVVMPAAFWYLSIAGAAITLAYLLAIGNAPLAISQSVSFIVYARNLALRRREVA